MTFDFDFQRYVERRKGLRETEAKEGAAYAYGGDLKVLRTISRLRPVTMALDAAVRLWKQSARAELLGTAIEASPQKFAGVFDAARRAASALHVALSPVHVSPNFAAGAYTFGTSEELAIVLDAALVEALSGPELDHVVGAELGHGQVGHAPFRTALYFLEHQASFARWITKPATASLAAWSRRADVTADRAGLLCTRNVDVSCVALAKVPLAADVAKRQAALRCFAESAYFRGVVGETGGYAPDVCDARVAEILSAHDS